MKAEGGFGERLRFARQRWNRTQDELAGEAGVGVATIRRAEGGKFEPRLETARRLADALMVRVEWLLTGDEPMLWTSQMTMDEQHRAHTGPGTEGLPGYLVFPDGRWYRDDSGEWRVDRSAAEGNEG